MSGDGFLPIGDTLQVRVEEDLIFVRNSRVMTLRDLHELTAIYAKVRQAHPVLLVMYDSSQSEGISRDARRAMTEKSNASATADATVVFGASFAVRTLTNMIERAVVGLGRRPFGLKLVATEAEARVYLNQERQRILASRTTR